MRAAVRQRKGCFAMTAENLIYEVLSAVEEIPPNGCVDLRISQWEL